MQAQTVIQSDVRKRSSIVEIITELGKASAFIGGTTMALGTLAYAVNDTRDWLRRRRGQSTLGRGRLTGFSFWSTGIGALLALGSIPAALDRTWDQSLELAAVASILGAIGLLLVARNYLGSAREQMGRAEAAPANSAELTLRNHGAIAEYRRLWSSASDARVIQYFAIAVWAFHLTWLDPIGEPSTAVDTLFVQTGLFNFLAAGAYLLFGLGNDFRFLRVVGIARVLLPALLIALGFAL